MKPIHQRLPMGTLEGFTWEVLTQPGLYNKEALYLYHPDGNTVRSILAWHHLNGRSVQETKEDLAYYIPDYLNDRDAVAVVMGNLTRDQGNDMMDELRYILNRANDLTPHWCGPTPFDYIKATPAQLTEAILRATGNWKEETL